MTEPLPTGHLGNLTKEEEQKLKEFWGILFQVFGVVAAERPTGPQNGALKKSATESSETGSKKSKGRFSMFGWKSAPAVEAPVAEKKNDDSAAAKLDISISHADDKYGQTKEFYDALAKHSQEDLRVAFWTMAKHDHPDALLLRYLRARKWDVKKALAMLIATIHWRLDTVRLDSDVMKNGDIGPLDHPWTSSAKKDEDDFKNVLKLGESFCYGRDREGRPVCYIRVKLHRIGQFSHASIERYTVYLIETARLFLKHPHETATLVFDMTDFGMINLDYPPIKFIIKCFEANYPESLGAVLVHKAPWIFLSVWNLIRSWLDPVVAAKVHFTKTFEELEGFIARDQIIKEVGGDNPYEYAWIEPKEGENEKLKDTATRDSLLAVRLQYAADIQEATKAWMACSDAEEEKQIKEKREDLVSKLSENYWLLDPYVRATSIYDRMGLLPPKKSVPATPVSGVNGVNGAHSISEKRSADPLVTAKPIAVESEVD